MLIYFRNPPNYLQSQICGIDFGPSVLVQVTENSVFQRITEHAVSSDSVGTVLHVLILKSIPVIFSRFHSSSALVPVNCFVAILPCFAIFKNVVHCTCVWPGETSSNSASHQTQNNVQRS